MRAEQGILKGGSREGFRERVLASYLLYTDILCDIDTQGATADKRETEGEGEAAQQGVVLKAIDKAVHAEIPCLAKFLKSIPGALEFFGAFHLPHDFFYLFFVHLSDSVWHCADSRRIFQLIGITAVKHLPHFSEEF